MNDLEIKSFLKDYTNLWDFYGLIDELVKKELLTVVKTRPGQTGIIESSSLSFFTISSGRSYFALAFTGDNEIGFSSKDGFYAQIVNFQSFMKYVLNSDLDGIIINRNSDNIIISRKFIRFYMRNSICQSIEDYSRYIFEI